jgi:hypothetical protein
MVIFQQRDGKKVKMTKKQFRNFFLKQKKIAEIKKELAKMDEMTKEI